MPGEIAVIFDLDGTLIDNNPFHIKAWQEFYSKRNRTLTEEEYKEHFNGKTNTDVLAHIFTNTLSAQENNAYTIEKEDLYRRIYEPHIKPVKGLLTLLQQLQDAKIPMAIATSGIKENIDYMFKHLDIKHFFKDVIYSKDIQKGKPDPEIYFITATRLNIPVNNCVVFEDSVAGIQSAKAAGMKVIAIATTHLPEELKSADNLIYDYDDISINEIFDLVKTS